MLKIAFDKIYKHPLDENHRFPMIKYDLIPEQLLRENTCNQDNFFIPSKLDDYNALLTHDKDYYERFSSLELTKKELRPIGFPMSKELVVREKKIAQVTETNLCHLISLFLLEHGIRSRDTSNTMRTEIK